MAGCGEIMAAAFVVAILGAGWLFRARRARSGLATVQTSDAESRAQIRWWALAGGAVWTFVAVCAFAWMSAIAHGGVIALAAAQARASFRKDVAYRRWALSTGGVYVPAVAAALRDERVPPEDRTGTTEGGRALTLVSPSTITREVLDADAAAGGPRARITGAHPLRPENRPDAWEAKALARLERGEPDVVEEIEGDPPVLRYMGRLASDATCSRCHGPQPAGPAELRGGISIAVPIAPYLDAADAQAFRCGTVVATVWAFGICAIAIAAAVARRRARERRREREVRQKIEDDLAHARRLEAIGRVAADIAHDLKNLLAPILGNAEMALEQVAPGTELSGEIEDIQEAAKRARVLAQRLLAFGRKQELALEPLDPRIVVQQILPMVRGLPRCGIELRSDLARGLPGIRADRVQLEAVLLNLAANARDAMPGGGVLGVSANVVALDEFRATRAGVAEGPYVAIEVSDTGTGIESSHLKRLFEPFFTTKTKGTGLGLASSHGTVRQLGGAIEVETAPGKGSRFRVLLPALETEVATPPSLRQSEPTAVGRETVLLVEDDAAIRRYASSALVARGYSVLAARDGEEALQMARELRRGIDVLVTDLQMPGMDGRELHARLVEVRPGLPTVFVSAWIRDASADQGPGTLFLPKPFTPAELATALRQVLEERPPLE